MPKFSQITIYFIDHQEEPLIYYDMEWIKEAYGISIVKEDTAFPNTNKVGKVEVFIPYASILRVDARRDFGED